MAAAGCGEVPPEESFATDVSSLAKWGVRELGPGANPSLALDERDYPRIAARQGVADPGRPSGDTTPVFFTNNGLWRSAAGWTSEHIAVIPDHVEASTTSLAFDGTTAQLVYSSRYQRDRNAPMSLKLATRGAAGWQVGTFADDGWIWQAVQRVSDGATWVVYPDPTQGSRLRVSTTYWGGGWTTYGVSIPHALLNSLDFAITDPSVGKPVLGVATTTIGNTPATRGLQFTTSFDGGVSWEPVVHVDATSAMIGPQIAYSGHDPMVAYTELDANRAKFASSADGGLTWTVESIGTFDSSPATGLAIDPKTGAPVVAITAKDLFTNEDRLYVARRISWGNWALEIVDTVDMATGWRFAVNPRIVVASDQTVMIAYEAYNHLDQTRIRFAWQDAPSSVTPMEE